MIVDPNNKDLLKAGKIASEVREFAKSLTVKGAKLLDITKATEKKIIDLGGKIAFPPQLSLNHIAAHYYPDFNDTIILNDEVVKIDVGVHVNGYIGDTACTVDLSGKNKKLVDASRQALNEAIKIIKPGITIAKIGETIQKTISSFGLAPVKNLSGHGLGLYKIHESPSIPNYDSGETITLEENQLIAIEPFATNGVGMIQEGTSSTLFSLIKKRPIRMQSSRNLLKFILNNYGDLVFAKRWLRNHFKPVELEFALRDLLRNEIIRWHPPLGEKANGLVSQAEHTVIVMNKPKIITL